MKFYWCSYDIGYPEGSEIVDTSFFKTEEEVAHWFRDKKEDAAILYLAIHWREHNYTTQKGWKATCCTSGMVNLYVFEVRI